MKSELRNKVTDIIVKSIRQLLKRSNPDVTAFDIWHGTLCQKIISIYKDKDIPFYYGQAQKWINMTMKYFCVLYLSEANRIIHLMHPPVDSIFFERAEDLLSIDYPVFRWSRMDSQQYKKYLKSIRGALSTTKGAIPPMIWEYRNWER